MESRKNYKELNRAVDTLAKQIAKSLQYSETAYDRTYISVITKINSNGTYNVKDEYGKERTVVCALPFHSLEVGQRVYLTIPSGNLNNLYISGVHPQIINR